MNFKDDYHLPDDKSRIGRLVLLYSNTTTMAHAHHCLELTRKAINRLYLFQKLRVEQVEQDRDDN